jgi:hypothetical protein
MSTSSYLVDLHSSCRLHHTLMTFTHHVDFITPCRLHHTLSTSTHLGNTFTSCRLHHTLSTFTHHVDFITLCQHHHTLMAPPPHVDFNTTSVQHIAATATPQDIGTEQGVVQGHRAPCAWIMVCLHRFASLLLHWMVALLTRQVGSPKTKGALQFKLRAVWNLRASLPGLPATSHLETPSEFAADRSVACLRAVWNLRALLPGLPAMHCSSCLGDGGWWMDSWLVGGHIHGLGWCLTSHKTCLLVGGWWNTCHGYESNLLNPPALVLTCSCTHLLLYSPALVLTCSCTHLLLCSPTLLLTCSCTHPLLHSQHNFLMLNCVMTSH